MAKVVTLKNCKGFTMSAVNLESSPTTLAREAGNNNVEGESIRIAVQSVTPSHTLLGGGNRLLNLCFSGNSF